MDHAPKRDDLLELSQKMVSYYQWLCEGSVEWQENLRLAIEWRELLHLDKPDRQRAVRLLRDLHGDSVQQGTAWFEFSEAVRRWVEKV